MKKTLILVITALLALSCSNDRMRLQSPDELGTDQDEYVVGADGGEVLVKVYANSAGTVSLAREVPWASLDRHDFDADADFCVTVSSNDGLKRMVPLIIRTGTRKDTVNIKQEGAWEENFKLGASSAVIYNKRGRGTGVYVQSNIPESDITFRIVYLDAEYTPWITSVGIQEDSLMIATIDNTDNEKIRKAAIDVRYTNGWGEQVESTLMLTQANARNMIGNQLSFEALRALASDKPVTISSDYTIEGYVVSDKDSGNAGDNVQSTSTTIDATVCQRTAYLESPDGKYGVMLVFSSAEDNILSNNTRAVINLEDAVLMREGTADVSDNEPLRYSISGLSSSKVVSCTEVDAATIPSKNKNISELTDDDIYTRVTLVDCEFPVRKGSLTPVNEGYTSLYSANRITKFPTLVRGKDGASLYMYTNITCPYRRDGERIGYGSGNVTGVVVHEKCRRFVDKDADDEDLCGNIGKYQIRHMSREDIAFEDAFEDGFSEMICEWRFLSQGNAGDNSWNATYGKGTMNHSYSGAVHGSFNTHCYPSYSFSYLGLCGKAYTTNESGFGVILENGTDYGRDYVCDCSKGNLSVNNDIALAWLSSNWWSAERKSPEYWFLNFSTQGIQTDHLSLQLSSLNVSQEGCSPVKWKLQWAETNTASTQWKDIAEYSVPDIVLWTATQPWQCPGFKAMDFELPLEMLGKDNVYVRMIPIGQKGNGNTPQGYLDTDYKNGSNGSTSKANNAIDYVAVRYNK